jgi:hypothetical protein
MNTTNLGPGYLKIEILVRSEAFIVPVCSVSLSI